MSAFEDLDVLGTPREVIAFGGVLDPSTLVAAYRAGCFPWPASGRHVASLDRSARRLARRGVVPLLPGTSPDGPLVPWCSPDPRAVLLTHSVLVPRSLRQRLRHSGWETTLDTAFAEVVAGCADRDETWITDPMAAGYIALHAAGGAHSLEVWAGDRLVGGLYGVLTGQVFSGESMFFTERDASKVALVDLCARLLEAGVVLLDTQQESTHLGALGQLLISREEYVALVHRLRDRPATLDAARRPVARLAAGT